MIDCKHYRIQMSTNEQWCREGLDIVLCSENCPWREPCDDDVEKENRIYPDDV